MGGHGSLIYSFVARGSEIIAEYNSDDSKGDFNNNISLQSFQSIASSTDRFSFTYHGHTFNFLVHGGFIYGVVATESMGRKVPMEFLERIKEDFARTFGEGTSSMSSQLSHTKNFRKKLKDQLRYHVEHSGHIEKLSSQVVEITEIVKKNIDSLVLRGEELEILIEKTEELKNEAQTYKRIGREMNRNWKDRLKGMKTTLLIIVVIVLFILIIVLCISLKLIDLIFLVHLQYQILG